MALPPAGNPFCIPTSTKTATWKSTTSHPDDRSGANKKDFMLAYGLKHENHDNYEEPKAIRDALRENYVQDYAEQELSRSSAARETVGDQQAHDSQQDEHQHGRGDDTEEQYDSEGCEESYILRSERL
ncbi:uncharacterized protein PFLUO_LOCUS4929 [Penicillium psychrofluorescens]|uniref:uncharacterized protein n=1 Tax=Penicillium psychrofluorescens TaxID=3158075 RepID=UPI003CCD5256